MIDAGLCDTCQYVKPIATARGTVFVFCQRAQTAPVFPKYPAVPVRQCCGYRPHEGAASASAPRGAGDAPATRAQTGGHAAPTPLMTPWPHGAGQGWNLGAWERQLTNAVGMPFVLIPAGGMTMGSTDGYADERPMHRVGISRAFYLGRTPVTQAQWARLMGAIPVPSRMRPSGRWTRSRGTRCRSASTACRPWSRG